jgi:hypothetical protein
MTPGGRACSFVVGAALERPLKRSPVSGFGAFSGVRIYHDIDASQKSASRRAGGRASRRIGAP